MTVTAAVLIDLTTTKVEAHRNRMFYALNATPNGARVVLIVGALVPGFTSEAFRFLAQHLDRVDVEIQGEAQAVKAWLNALRTGDVIGSGVLI